MGVMDDYEYGLDNEYDNSGYDSNVGTGYEDTSYNNYGGNADYGSGQQMPQDQTPYQPDYGNQDYYGGINTGGVSTGTGATPNFVNPMVQNSPAAGTGGGIQQALAGLFSGSNAGMLGKGIAALFEGSQNKQKQAAYNKIASNPALDPFGSQRPFYQQQAQQAVTNPYDSPIVKAQIAQLQNAQNIKDAAAGRRSNSLTSSPAVMAEMAKIAQNYQGQMAQQGGSNIAPQGQTIANLQSQGANAGINGYVSPLANAYGYGQQSTSNDDMLKKVEEALAKFKAQG